MRPHLQMPPSPSQASTPIVFSTRPQAVHQQQLFVNFPKSIRLSKGDTLTGKLSCRPAAAGERSVVLDLVVEFKGVTASASFTLPPILQAQHA